MRRALIATLACLGCSSHYMPRANGRVAITMQNGQWMYVRDGQFYSHGLLGGELQRAVAGNPAAEAAAAEYHDRMRDGILEVVLGSIAMTGGAAYAAATAAQDPGGRPNVTAPLLFALGGMVLMFVGTGELATAEPYRWDAINLFNDGAEPSHPPSLSPPGWTASRVDAKASLHMR